MERKQVIELIDKYRKGTQTSDEKAVFESWYIHEAANSGYEISDEDLERNLELIARNLPLKYKKQTHSLWPRIAAVAAVLLVIGLSIFFYSRYTNTLRHLVGSAATRDLANDIKPGSNKAYLVLSNGKRLSLTDAANGAIAKEAGVEISKAGDGQVIYGSQVNYSNALNTIETPKGGQYQVRLPDGSKVWLNAASKLIYPVSFSGRGQREVILSGEAYFEVAKDAKHPFRVSSGGQVVQVLGTHFNINSYVDESNVKTTLLEGSVQVSTLQPLALSGRDGQSPERVDGSEDNKNSSLPARGISPRGGERFGVVLKPGEQATLTKGKIKIKEIEVEDAVAWKNGYFMFNSENLESIMNRISRWYNVNIEYEDPSLKKETFFGSISKFEKVSKVLNMLERTDVATFTIEGNTIKIKKKK